MVRWGLWLMAIGGANVRKRFGADILTPKLNLGDDDRCVSHAGKQYGSLKTRRPPSQSGY